MDCLPESVSRLKEIVKSVRDTRTPNVRHKLPDIILISLFAMLAGAEHYTEFEEFGRLRNDWFENKLKIKKIPSHDTFQRIFEVIDYNEFELVLREWTQHLLNKKLIENLEADIISLDGKAQNGCPRFSNIVSAYSSESGLVLGGVSTEESKQNELHSMVRLIRQLRLNGAIVTADAAGTYANVVGAIVEKGGEYVLPVKENQSNLLDDIKCAFTKPFGKVLTNQTLDKHSGRVEERKYDLQILGKHCLPFAAKWKKLMAIGRCHSTVSYKGVVTESTRFFITSVSDVKLFAKAVRKHWGIENGLHWQLDVVFKEDECKVRDLNAQKNLNTLRKIVLNALKQIAPEASPKKQRKWSGWSPDYFDKLAEKFLK